MIIFVENGPFGRYPFHKTTERHGCTVMKVGTTLHTTLVDHKHVSDSQKKRPRPASAAF